MWFWILLPFYMVLAVGIATFLMVLCIGIYDAIERTLTR